MSIRLPLFISALCTGLHTTSVKAQEPSSVVGCWDVTPEYRNHPIRIEFDTIQASFWRKPEYLTLKAVGRDSNSRYLEWSFWTIARGGRIRAVLHYHFTGFDFDLTLVNSTLEGTAKWFNDTDEPRPLGKVIGHRIACPASSG